jgi:hypothetical protein
MAIIIPPAPLAAIVILSVGPANAVHGTPINAGGFASTCLCQVGINCAVINANNQTTALFPSVATSGTNQWSTSFTVPSAGTWILQVSSVAGTGVIKTETSLNAS